MLTLIFFRFHCETSADYTRKSFWRNIKKTRKNWTLEPQLYQTPFNCNMDKSKHNHLCYVALTDTLQAASRKTSIHIIRPLKDVVNYKSSLTLQQNKGPHTRNTSLYLNSTSLECCMLLRWMVAGLVRS